MRYIRHADNSKNRLSLLIWWKNRSTWLLLSIFPKSISSIIVPQSSRLSHKSGMKDGVIFENEREKKYQGPTQNEWELSIYSKSPSSYSKFGDPYNASYTSFRAQASPRAGESSSTWPISSWIRSSCFRRSIKFFRCRFYAALFSFCPLAECDRAEISIRRVLYCSKKVASGVFFLSSRAALDSS